MFLLRKREKQAVFKRWTMVSCDEPTRLEDAQQPLLSSAGHSLHLLDMQAGNLAGTVLQGTAHKEQQTQGRLLQASAVRIVPLQSRAAPNLTLNLEPDETPRGTPADAEVFVQPSLAKGMPFHNGFLYKLGDGLLNTGWNLRYFLLIGCQTLQYYRSQHEAKPRDAISLSGVSVEWSHDASRPFTFVVSKSGQRSFCLSGCTEREACEWVERIQARVADMTA
ncbi:skap2, partial [Symbiodinium necroappetens]